MWIGTHVLSDLSFCLVNMLNRREASTIKVNEQTRSLFGRTVGTVGVVTSYEGEIWGSDVTDY